MNSPKPGSPEGPAERPFLIEVEGDERSARVTLCGELDVLHCDWIASELERLTEIPTVVLDLRQLTFVDSVGALVLERSRRRAQSEGRRFVVVPGPDKVRRVFRLCGIEETFDRLEEPQLVD